MRRCLFTLPTVLSLLLCVAVCVLWVRSYRVPDLWVRQDGPVGHVLRSDEGRIVYRRCSGLPSDRFPWRRIATEPEGMPRRAAGWSDRLGFGYGSYQDFLMPRGPLASPYVHPLEFHVWQVWLAYWLVAALTFVLPLVTMAQLARRVRPKPGLCPRCGYDLRATPGRCPECATEPPPAPSR